MASVVVGWQQRRWLVFGPRDVRCLFVVTELGFRVEGQGSDPAIAWVGSEGEYSAAPGTQRDTSGAKLGRKRILEISLLP